MQHKVKKALEHKYLDVLVHDVPDFPNGQIFDHERPDFLIKNSEQVLGVEITRIYQESPTGRKPGQAIESEQRSLIQTARKYYEQMNLPHLEVQFLFTQSSFGKRKRPELAKELAHTIAAHVPCEDEWCSLDQDYRLKPILPDGIESISIGRFHSLTKDHWTRGGAGFVQEDCIETLQQKINEKNVEYTHYRRHCDDCWLLIVADGTSESSFLEPSQQSIAHEYTTGFGRVYFLPAFSRQLSRLKTIGLR